ncbi:hypothetical protein SAMN05216251_102371 [Actinacidiphila alni]|uniref:Uncharacterized protein n=1 Tax=Actinacidiphila alni TaxID=380248 RepID=A0A1I1Z9S0_9ACTN|nr:hypothetical protein [Actinacidiphila alni]SFE28439.1 hypothetical protein SAMN05216251_102371 [Actinacidiphila alni]
MEDLVGGWIWSENTRRFLGLVAHYVGYDFDPTDWQTIHTGLTDTDDEQPDGWYSYPLAGPLHQVDVHLANCVGGRETAVRVTGVSDAELRLRAETLIAAFAS